MIPISPALIIAGPAIVQYRGKTFYSKANIQANVKLETFEVTASRFGHVEDRESNLSYEIKFTPVGTLDALSVLWPYGASVPGTFLHAAKTFGAIDTAADSVTITAHGFRDGEACQVASYGTLPTGLAAGTVYFLHKIDADTISFYDTEAHAIAGLGTGKVDITATGTSVNRVIEQPYLVLWSADGIKYTFSNAVVSGMPDFNAAATEQAIGEVTFEAFRQFAMDPTNAAAIYTRTAAANTDASFDPSLVITQAYGLVWGGAAPWNAMTTKAGAKLSFGLNLTPITDDAGGVLTRRIDSVTAQCVARPNNVDENALWQMRGVQGSGAGRGRRITGNDLHVNGTGMFLCLYGASIKESPVNYDGKEDRLGDITWVANRSVSGGAFNPVFAVSNTAID
jgi:hypothetical protein